MSLRPLSLGGSSLLDPVVSKRFSQHCPRDCAPELRPRHCPSPVLLAHCTARLRSLSHYCRRYHINYHPWLSAPQLYTTDAPSRRNSEQRNVGGERNSNLDIIFNRRKYSHDDSREEGDHFQPGDELEFVHYVERGG